MLETAVGIGFAVIGEEHLFTFLLSSPASARTVLREAGQTEEIRRELQISLALSIALSLILAVALGSVVTFAFGSAFGTLLYWIYKTRAGL